MKIYVASSWRNTLQPSVVARLREAGHEVYDFRNPEPGDNGFSWKQIHDTPPPWSAVDTIKILQHPTADRGFDLDFSAMKWADACVMLQPCGRSAAMELGWMAGAKKLTIALLADGQEPELMIKMADYICADIEDVVGYLEIAEEDWPKKSLCAVCRKPFRKGFVPKPTNGLLCHKNCQPMPA